MKIYFAPDTRAVRIVWLCEELGLDYELESFKLGDPAMRAPEYLAINPLGRVPTVEDGDVTLSESGAIVEYILAKYGDGRLVPETSSPDLPMTSCSLSTDRTGSHQRSDRPCSPRSLRASSNATSCLRD